MHNTAWGEGGLSCIADCVKKKKKNKPWGKITTMHNIPRKLPTQGKSKDKEVSVSTLNHKTTAAVSGGTHSKHTSHWSVAVCRFWALASLTDAVTCGWRWCARTGRSTLCEVPWWPVTSPKHGLTAGPRLARWPNVDKKIWCDVGALPSFWHRLRTEDSWPTIPELQC